ncbi:hypothetical protein B4168_2328 [Anoxybacillus flavithermus]|nr:transposase, IS3 family [Parageobacillus thermoglucosidasius TNO-09.020]KYD15119.1 hypothetical protein B4168_2328 [Anoxybacillus flavithermus]OAO85979.1 Mobile element protein [Parageobacillus thermoglucosidasius]
MAKMCEVLGISRSGYYAWTKRPESQQKKRQEALKKQIKKIHIESRETYGSPKITKILQKQGGISKNGRQNHERWGHSFKNKEKI